MSDALQPLLDSIILLVSQCRMGESLQRRHQTVRAVRELITQILQTGMDDETNNLPRLREQLEVGLTHVRQMCLSGSTEVTREHLEYCAQEVRLAFELAAQIGQEHAAGSERAKILIEDLPIFRPFEYHTESTETAHS